MGEGVLGLVDGLGVDVLSGAGQRVWIGKRIEDWKTKAKPFL